MPVHIQKHPPAGVFSNQHQFTPNEHHGHDYKTKSGGLIHVSAPYCDWLTLTAPIRISDVFQSATCQGEDPGKYLEKLAIDARATLGQTIKKGFGEDLAFKFKVRMAGYSTGHKRLGPDAASTGFFVANKLDKHQTGYKIRINLNPARLTASGLDEIDTVFTMLFGEEINFKTWLGRARYTRIDVAVDLINALVSDLVFQENETSKWSSFHDPSFGLETFSRLKKTNKGKWRPDVRVYNKSKELEDKGKAAPYGALPHVRIEATKQTLRWFRDLQEQPNPFEGHAIGYLPDIASQMPCGFSNFVHASMRVGLARALEDVPPQLRDDFAAALKSAHAVFWKPDKNWVLWSDGLAQSGLLKWVKHAKAAANT